jgi:predicted HTH domain antitoxin
MSQVASTGIHALMKARKGCKIHKIHILHKESRMETTQRVRKTDLARNTHQIIRDAQRGQTILIENHGQAEVAILDVLDYYILRAVSSYYTHPSRGNRKTISNLVIAKMEDRQSAYDLSISSYLAGSISLGHTAELIDLPLLDLQARFIRLGVPLNLGAKDKRDAKAEVQTARDF